jgi:hypothetical protein
MVSRPLIQNNRFGNGAGPCIRTGCMKPVMEIGSACFLAYQRKNNNGYLNKGPDRSLCWKPASSAARKTFSIGLVFGQSESLAMSKKEKGKMQREGS